MDNTTTDIRDIHGNKIKAGQDIIYIANPKKIYEVISENNKIGHTVKYKENKYYHQSFLHFLKNDDLKTFEIIYNPELLS